MQVRRETVALCFFFFFFFFYFNDVDVQLW